MSAVRARHRPPFRSRRSNVAARDWHAMGATVQPLPSPDAQRFRSVSRSLLPLARATFAGHIGLEMPYATDSLSAGELNEIIAAGYDRVAGVFGCIVSTMLRKMMRGACRHQPSPRRPERSSSCSTRYRQAGCSCAPDVQAQPGADFRGLSVPQKGRQNRKYGRPLTAGRTRLRSIAG